MQLSLRDELRGVGEDLVDLNIQVKRKHHGRADLFWQWSDLFFRIVPVDDSDLRTALHDPLLLVGHGEQLLDLAIRMSTEVEWTKWLKASLQVSACAGNAVVLNRLLAVGGGEMGCCCKILDRAAMRGRTDVLMALLVAGAGPLVREAASVDSVLSPLQVAARAGHTAFVKGLVEAGAPLEYSAGTGKTALILAVQNGDMGVVLELLAGGANIDTFYDGRETPMMLCGPSVPPYYTPLCIAVAFDDRRMVQLLMDAGAALRPVKEGAPCPLHVAAYHGNSARVEQLLAGANINFVDSRGFSALHVAASFNTRGAVNMLLRHGADATALTHKGRSPMDVVATKVSKKSRGHDQSCARRLILHRNGDFSRNEAQTSADICRTLKRASAWGRRGWLVMMHARHLAGSADDAGKSVMDALQREAVLGGKERVRKTTLYDRGQQATKQWRGAVIWLLQCPDDGVLFQNIVRFF